MANRTYYVGKYREEALNGPYRGWVFGDFVKDADDPCKTSAVEVKYWEFSAGPTTHKSKTQGTTEAAFLLDGEIEGHVDGESIRLRDGDYIVLKPGTPNNIIETVHQPARGLTIKAPSDPSAKHELPGQVAT